MNPFSRLIHKEISPSRKFINAIYKSSEKYANWDPPIEIKPGSWGRIDRKTGMFEYEGNIYTDSQTASLAASLPPIECEEEAELVICSKDGRRIEPGAGPQLTIDNLAEAALSGRCEFSKSNGALLVMAHPKITHLPNELLILLFRNVEVRRCFQDHHYVLVTQVHSCKGFLLCSSDFRHKAIDFTLSAHGPLSSTPSMPNASSGESPWRTTFHGGVQREGYSSDGTHAFWPLYSVRKIGGMKRSHRGPMQVDELSMWEEQLPPWGDLDENGEEAFSFQLFSNESSDDEP